MTEADAAYQQGYQRGRTAGIREAIDAIWEECEFREPEAEDPCEDCVIRVQVIEQATGVQRRQRSEGGGDGD